jgi:hypothetical protein
LWWIRAAVLLCGVEDGGAELSDGFVADLLAHAMTDENGYGERFVRGGFELVHEAGMGEARWLSADVGVGEAGVGGGGFEASTRHEVFLEELGDVA